MQDFVVPAKFSTSDSPSRSSEPAFITHHDLKRFFKRYALTIWAATLVGVAIAAVYVFFTVPLYTARTQIIIDPSLPQVLRESNNDAIFSIDNAQVESQLEVLRSERIANAVIDKLGLETNPEFKSGLKKGGDTFSTRRAILTLFETNLSVRRVGLSYAIEILFSSASPTLAAEIANATAEAYVAEQVAARAQAVHLSGQWLEERIDQLRRQMNKAALDAQEFRAKRDYRLTPADANSKRAAPTDAGDRLPQITMEELDSTAQTYRRIYESFLLAYTESVQKQSNPATNARVITAATPPMVKSHPRTKLVFAFGTLMGWLAGLGIAFFRHNTDRSISNPLQIREELGLECLASIPCLPSYDQRSALLRAIPQSGITNKALRWLEEYFPVQIQAAPRDPYKNGTPLDTVATLPFSSFSFGIKKLKAAISIAGRARQLRCIGITSALPGEGKTTIAANLAALFAVSGIRTLLIDGDLLNHSLSRSLAPASEVGLLEAISGESELQNCIVRPENANFDLLPVADICQSPGSDGLLGSERARRLMEDLKKDYEFIIVEMPPLVANLDALTMGSMLDATLLLAQSGRTPMPVILESAYLLRNARLDTLGVVLNMVEPSMVNYGDAPGNYRPHY